MQASTTSEQMLVHVENVFRGIGVCCGFATLRNKTPDEAVRDLGLLLLSRAERQHMQKE